MASPLLHIFSFWGELAALGAASCWAMASLVFTDAGRQIGALNLNKLRVPIALACITATLWIKGGPAASSLLHTQDYVLLSLSGIIGLVVGDSCYFRSLVIMGPRRATLLMSASPVMAALVAWPYLGEQLAGIAWTGILVTLAGISWVTAERSTGNNDSLHGSKVAGVLLALTGATGQALGLVIAKKVLVDSGVPPLNATFVRMAAATITIWTLTLLRGEIHSTLSLMRRRRVRWAVMGGAILGPFLGVWLSLVAVKHIETGVAATLMASVPVLILPLVILVYHEKLSWRAVLGAFIAVGGVALLFLR